MTSRTWAMLACAALWAFSAAACSCDEEQSEEDVLAALADRLTDSLGFEGAEVVEGAPPGAHQGDPDYPQVTELAVPPTLSAGQPYTVTLSSDFSRPAEARGAIVHVKDATRHLKVKSTLDPEALIMRLLGTLKDDSELVGKSFTINLAIYDGAGAVGNYMTWGLEVAKPEETAPTTEQLQEAMEVSGGVRVQGNIPKGSSDPAAPQVIEISIPDKIGVGKEFAVTVSYQNGSDELRTVLMQVDNSTSYFELRASAPPQSAGDVTFNVKFNESKLGAKTAGLANAQNALSATASHAAALGETTVSIKVALVDASGKSGVPKTRQFSFTTESGTCTGKGCDVSPDGGAAVDGGVDHDAGRDASVPTDAGKDGGVITDGGTDAGDGGGEVCGDICSPNQIPFSADAVPQATISIDPGRQTCGLLTGYQQPDSLVIDQSDPGYFTGSFGPGWTDLIVSAGMLYENFWEGIPGNTELYVSMTHSGSGTVVGLTMMVTQQNVTVSGLCFGAGGGADGGVVTDGGVITDGGADGGFPDGGRKFKFTDKTVDGIAVANNAGWVVGAATNLDAGYASVGWNTRTGQNWQQQEFTQNYDIFPNPAGDGAVFLSKGGPGVTCLDSQGQASCMMIALQAVYADFGGGTPSDLLVVYGSNMIEIMRGYGNGSGWDGQPVQITGTTGAQWRLLAFAPDASTMGGIAVADPYEMMLEMYCNEALIQIPGNAWSTTYPVFRLAGAGRFAFAATNEGQYAGDPTNSSLLIFDSDFPARPQSVSAPNGDFWGVAAVQVGSTVRFAAGTGNDGVLLGAISSLDGSLCSDWLTAPGPVSDVAFTPDGNDLIFASGDTIEARDLIQEVQVCTPGGMALRR